MTGSSPNAPILYCSSVSPQPLAAGELLVYRHLSRLKGRGIILVSPEEKPPGKLENVLEQVRITSGSKWLWRLKQGPLFSFADGLLARNIVRQLALTIRRKKPAVVLSIFLPDVYLSAAAALAQRHQLPLVLLCHDDYEKSVPPAMRRRLRAIYRQAFARLCVSGPMAAEFERRYDAKGEVMYPIPSAPAGTPVEQDQAQLRIGFAGRFGLGYEEALVRLADALGEAGGKLVVLSQTSREVMQRFWSHPAVEDCGNVAPDQIDAIFRQNAVNALAVVQSFNPQDELAFRLNFPSKLTEYTTFGLPLLVVAPPSASAASWARGHSDVAVISSASRRELGAAIRRLFDPVVRFELAKSLYNVAGEFAPARLQSLFERTLTSAVDAMNPAGSAKAGE